MAPFTEVTSRLSVTLSGERHFSEALISYYVSQWRRWGSPRIDFTFLLANHNFSVRRNVEVHAVLNGQSYNIDAAEVTFGVEDDWAYISLGANSVSVQKALVTGKLK